MDHSPVERYYRTLCSHQVKAEDSLPKLNLKGDENILDIGCGDGKLSAKLASFVPHGRVLGLDNLEFIIEFAKQNFPSQNYPNLEFQKGDAQNLNFQNEFDIVVSVSCLHIIVDHNPVLKGIYQALKDSGKFFLLIHAKESQRGISSVIQNLLQSEKWIDKLKQPITIYGFYTPEEYETLLAANGLVPETMNLHKIDKAYEGKAELTKDILNTWLSLSSKIPDYLYQEFSEDIIEKYIELNPPNPEGIIHTQELFLEIIAKK